MRHILIALLLLCSAFAQGGVKKDWTVLVFLNGHNNLDDFGPFNINEMEQVGSTKKVNVVVQWASAQAPKTKRLYVTKDNDIENVHSKVVQELRNVDMGDSKTLVDFIVWGAKHYPAKHYFVVVWDHGSGWHLQSDNPFKLKDISWDDNTGHFIKTVDLGSAMYQAASKIGQKIDLYGSDACLMAMPEVSAEMRKAVDYFVGSEETEPGQGWPYNTMLAEMNNLTDNSPANVAKVVVKTYVEAYSPNGVHNPSEVTFSALDLKSERQVTLFAAVRMLSAAVLSFNASQKAQLMTALQNTQRFTYADYGDLIDFLDQLDTVKIDSPTLNAAAADIRQSLSSLILAHAESPSYARAHGLSMWLPADAYSYNSYAKEYSTLEFAQLTGWDIALKSLFN